ncbi:TIGR03619 family F420-dependent LLM class oxidoreductase [Amycolatopsis rhizosphaerae]|uniref:TIGR03619 family F420-dependent LLM class oxidoreductase n=1 Tax=Amycolatopsis rhizosphaerae TaxID=2053003 RepID=A0A558C6Y4_9PSEU|nr:TIGR03619 family F420-dependent LLM class oxidoreductase [Amycolatopsis rhizosphaerae]TVT44554.1 TIGR03619 family F420-dependent LLM class oxidoreductase [Amycolatopsis rhizosphaerae]
MADPTLSMLLFNYGDRIATHGPGAMIAAAETAEAAGVDRLVVVDHVVMGPDTDAYSWGSFPTEPDSPWLEPLTTLAVLAGRTRRIRLATGVVVAALRGAAVLAKTAATLDLLSAGRFDLGVGTGWQAKEYEAAGLDFARRGPLLDDTLAAVRALWDGAPAAVDLPSLRFADVWCSPRSPGVPIWVSGSLTGPVLRRLVRWGDGWIPIMGITPERLRTDITRLHSAFREAGRDLSGLQVQGRLPVVRGKNGAADLDATLARVPDLLAAGVTDVSFTLPALSRNPEEALTRLPALVKGFREVVAQR